MDPNHIHIDERLVDTGCVYCGCLLVDTIDLDRLRAEGPAGRLDEAVSRQRTRDHVPSRAFLDRPFPPNLPVVECCHRCNNGFSPDEQYLACLLECVVCGGIETELFERERVVRMLRDSATLRERLANARRSFDGGTAWEMESERVRHVVVKLARGHAAFEHQRHYPEPDSITITPLVSMSEDERIQFESGGSGTRLLPEVGSRALTQAVRTAEASASGWEDVQPGRYRYASTIYADGFSVRLVIREYLACEAWWHETA